jgi:hypothetical protein
MARFSLHRRSGIYHAQFWSNDLGKYLPAHSTGSTNRNEATLVVAGWMRDGWPTGWTTKPAGELFPDFLERFWTYDTSTYVTEKRAHGQRIGKRRCYDATSAVRAHGAPFFAGRRLETDAKKGPGSLRYGINFLCSRRLHIHATRCPRLAQEIQSFRRREDRDGNALDAFVEAERRCDGRMPLCEREPVVGWWRRAYRELERVRPRAVGGGLPT